MRNRERSAWKEVWAFDAMRDKHEVRMSDMRPAGNCRPTVAKNALVGRAHCVRKSLAKWALLAGAFGSVSEL
jgi:hypothetical protein